LHVERKRIVVGVLRGVPGTEKGQESERRPSDVILRARIRIVAVQRPMTVGYLLPGDPSEPAQHRGLRSRIAAQFTDLTLLDGPKPASKRVRPTLETCPFSQRLCGWFGLRAATGEDDDAGADGQAEQGMKPTSHGSSPTQIQ